MIEAVSGGRFADVMRSEVFSLPAGLTETFIDPPEAEYPRIARRYGRAKIMNAPYGRRLGSPSAGIFATARDLVKFAAYFFPTIQDENSRLLSAASVAVMTSDQTGRLSGGIEGIQEWPVCPWGLGWEVKGAKRPHWTGDLTSGRTFCHMAKGGTLLWADPASRISLAVLANRDISTGWATDPRKMGAPERSGGHYAAIDAASAASRMLIAASTSPVVMISGGQIRITFACNPPLPTSSPRVLAPSMSFRAISGADFLTRSFTNSTPTIRPIPRTSPMT